MRAQVMKKAWELYRKAGVKSMAAWSMSLRKAWAIVKATKEVKITLKKLGSEKVWVAVVTGTCPKFKYQREFVQMESKTWIGGSTWEQVYSLEEGKLYQIQEAGYYPYFAEVVNGEIKTVSKAVAEIRIA